ncbi:hypothetical protein CHUAL_013371 [Chamberlinius hualienensis]
MTLYRTTVTSSSRALLRQTMMRMLWCLIAIFCVKEVTGEIAHDHSNGLADHSSNSNHVKKLWGLTDSTATVGHLFQYHIPSDAFSGVIHHYKVYDSARDLLPHWIYFNNSSSTLEGVPTWKDVGQFYITVDAVGPETTGEKPSVAQDIFSVEVLPLKRKSSKVVLLRNAAKTSDVCEPSEEQTMLSIMIDSDMHAMEPIERVQLAKRLATLLNIDINALQMISLEYGDRGFDGNTIMAGPGNARKKHSAGLLLQWQVGCKGSELDPTHEAMVNSIDKSSRDGSLAEGLGYSVVGWHLATVSAPGVQIPRYKRQAFHAQPTPVPEVQPTKKPMFTRTVSESFFEGVDHDEDGSTSDSEDGVIVPETRIIPSMASPSFTYSTSTHRHRHQHELGGHSKDYSQHHHWQPKRHDEDGYLTASPTFRGLPAVVNTPSPTPILPIRPTQTYTSDVFEETATSPSTYSSRIITEPLPSDRVPVPQPSDTLDVHPTKAPEIPVPTSTVKPSVPNFSPVKKTRIQKQVFIAGKISRFQIPPGTFFDFEDGETSNLKLILTHADGSALQTTSWIQFSPVRQEIYAIPLEENIGKWEFHLEAMDSDGASVKELVEIHVRQHPSSRATHHEFVMHLKYDKWRFATNIDWQVKFAEHLAAFFSDPTDQNIVIRSVTTDPYVFTWTNESLPAYPCPHEQIQELLDSMVSNKDGVTSKLLRKAVNPEFRVIKTTVNLLGHCKAKSTPTSMTTTNNRPTVRNQIDHINATVGEFLHFRVPEDTFFDEEDGDVRKLKLIFLTIDGGAIPHSSWIQFNTVTQEFIGLPMAEDVGPRQYQLVAIDKEGSSANDALIITVHKRPESRLPSVEFSIRIDHDFHSFNNDLTKKVMVLDKLAHLYSDPDPRYIVVRSINHGSVVFTWTNNTLPSEPCPKEHVGQLVKIMFNDNGTVSRKLLETFQPEFNITGADVIPLGICLADITPTSITVGPTSTAGTEHAMSDDDIYITTIIPAVVIAAMLLIAAIIACILYRKKRKGKMTMEDSSTFVNKGIPIIFADELEDKPDPAKSPVIMKEEKPPLPPPEYHRSSRNGSPSSTPAGGRRRPPPEPQHRYMEMAQEPLMENTPPYQPPPPLTASRDTRLNRPKHTPNYRLPPPYVPP